MNYRVEKDSIGTKDVPEGVYYGVQSLRAAENFGSMSSFGVGFLGISPRYCVWSLFYIFKFYTYIRA